MPDTPLRIDQLLVIGYADVLPEGKGPAVVPPVFQLKDQRDKFMVPPFTIVGEWLAGHQAIDLAELKSLSASGEISLLENGKEQEACPDYLLWVDDEGNVAYQPLIEARQGLRLVGMKHLEIATEALKLGEIDRAEKHAGIALGASERDLEPRCILAACYQQRGDAKALQVITKSALSAGFSLRSFETVVAAYAALIPSLHWQARVTIANSEFESLKPVMQYVHIHGKSKTGVKIYCSGYPAEFIRNRRGYFAAYKMAKASVKNPSLVDIPLLATYVMRHEGKNISRRTKIPPKTLRKMSLQMSTLIAPNVLAGIH